MCVDREIYSYLSVCLSRSFDTVFFCRLTGILQCSVEIICRRLLGLACHEGHLSTLCAWQTSNSSVKGAVVAINTHPLSEKRERKRWFKKKKKNLCSHQQLIFTVKQSLDVFLSSCKLTIMMGDSFSCVFFYINYLQTGYSLLTAICAASAKWFRGVSEHRLI